MTPISRHALAVSALTFTLLALPACAPDSRSDAISNDELYTENTITADSSLQSVSCESAMTVGGVGGTTLTLSPTDTLSCGVEQSYSTSAKSSAGTYRVSRLAYRAGKTYQIKLERNGSSECGKFGTFVAQVTLPEPMNIVVPAKGAAISRSSAFDVRWNAGTADTVSITLSGVTAGTLSGSTSDIGHYTFPASQLANMQNGDATLVLQRIKNGLHPSGLKGGSTRAIQQQQISVTVTD